MSSQLQVTGEAKIRDIQGPVVANSGVITALDGAANQYVRGDGTLATFPTSGGGGSSVSYYLNGSVNQGTIGGVAYKELSKDPILGVGTDFTISANGYIASFITDANDPDSIIVPGGNWNTEIYFSVDSNSNSPYFYVEVYKYDGSTFTLLGSNQTTPEYITAGTTITPYYGAVAIPTTNTAITDRIAIRIYVVPDGRTVTLHTENSHLGQIVTTFSKGMTSLNNLTDQSQYLTTGTSGTDFNIASSGDTHTFNLPIASASNTGKLSSTDWSTFNNKVPYTGATADVDLGNFDLSASILKASVSSSASGSLILYTGSTGFTTGNTAVTLVSSPTQLNTLQIIFDIAGTQKFANIIGNSITSTRNYTLPDASGTFALTSNLSSYVPYTGATSNVDLGVYSLLGSFISANGSGGISGAIVIKQNGTMISGGSGEVTIGSANAGELSIFFGNTPYKATFLNTSLTASRTYTLPDLTGTIALLEGTQTFSGAKTFSNTITFNDYALMNIGVALAKTSGTPLYSSTNGYANLQLVNAGSVNSLYLNDGDTLKYAKLSFNNAADYTYTFPSASGTIALTSDLSGYVPYTGATANVNLGSNNLTTTGLVTANGVTSMSINVDGNGSNGGALNIKHNATTQVAGAGYVSIGAKDANTFYLYYTGATNADWKSVSLKTTNITNATGRVYEFPNADGTIALTSNLSAYLPLTGGTLTGALSGTSATFSGGITTNAYSYLFGLRISGNDTGNTIYQATGALGISTGGSAITFAPSLTTALTLASTGAATFSSSVTAASGLYNGYTSGLPPTSGSATRGGLRLNNASNIALDFGTVAAGQAWLQVSDANNYASNFALLLNPNGGNVGIGTISPINNNRLTVLMDGGTNGTGIAIKAVNDGGGGSQPALSYYNGSGNYIAQIVADNGTGYLGFNTGSANTERMRITSGGDVGIGTGSISWASGNRRVLELNGISDTLYGMKINGVQAGYMYHDPGDMYLATIKSASKIFVIAGSGGVYLAHGGTSWTSNSDERLKNINGTINNALDKIMTLRAVNFSWKSDDNKKEVLGLIAQDVEKVFPQVIDKNKLPSKPEENQIDDNEYLGVRYQELVPVLIAAIQELKAEIDTLKNK